MKLLILLFFSTSFIVENDLEWLKDKIDNKNKIKSFSVNMEYDYGKGKIIKYEIYFLENKNNSTLPYLLIKNYDLSSDIIIKDFKKYEFRNDTLFLDTNRNNSLEGYYKSYMNLLYPIQYEMFDDDNYNNISNILSSFIKSKSEKDNERYENDTTYYSDNTIVTELRHKFLQLEPFYFNAKGYYKFKFDENFSLLEFVEKQINETENNIYDTLYAKTSFNNYNFNPPDSSLFKINRPYNALIISDSVRIAKKKDLEERKKTAHLLPNKFTLNNQDVIDLTKHKDIKVYNFWGAWCGFCYLSYPSIQKINEEYGDKVEVIGWGAFDRDTSRIMPYIKKHKINFPYILGADSLARKLTVTGFPSTLIFKGNELQHKCGHNGDSLYYEIKEKLKELGVE